MPTFLGSLRGLALAPSLEKVSFAGRGFAITPTAATDRLEAVPQAVVCGFEWAIAAPNLTDVNRRLRLVEEEQRGFAYEGATMAYTILDTIRGHRTRELLDGAGEKHILLAYIGIGFAMARLPRPLWKKVLPGPALPLPPDDELAGGGRLRLRPGLLRHRALGRPAGDPGSLSVARLSGVLPACGGPGHRARAVVHPRCRPA